MPNLRILQSFEVPCRGAPFAAVQFTLSRLSPEMTIFVGVQIATIVVAFALIEKANPAMAAKIFTSNF